MALAIALAGIPAMGEEERVPAFTGTLSFEVKHDNVSMPLRYYCDGKRLRIELGKAGQPSRVWLTGIEGMEGIVTISPIKLSYTLEPDRMMKPRGSRGEGAQADDPRRRDPSKLEPLPDPEITELDGLPCRRYFLTTEGPDTELWVLENALPLPMTVMSMWSGLRDALPQVAEACRSANGMPIQVSRKNWRGKEQFSIKLQSVDVASPNPELFTIPDGYFRTRSATRMGAGKARAGGRPGGGRAGPGSQNPKP